jgi:hypothetical protein
MPGFLEEHLFIHLFSICLANERDKTLCPCRACVWRRGEISIGDEQGVVGEAGGG